MKKNILILLAVIFIMSFLSGCSPKYTRFQTIYLDLFDTVTTIAGYDKDEESFNKNALRIYNELSVYNQLYDIYNNYDGVNNLKTINDNAGIAPVTVDKKIIDMLAFSKTAYDLTDGQVNIAMGSVLRLWHTAREYAIENPENAYLPDEISLREAAEHMDLQDVIIDRNSCTVFLKDAAMSLDVGAVGKGYAVQAICSQLKDEGLSGYVVSVGGNVYALGEKADGGKWQAGVEDPEDISAVLLTVGISDLAVVTSGSYQRYYTVDGKDYNHIIDPDTLYPSDVWSSVTVISSDSAMADILSTALFNMDAGSGRKLAESLDNTEVMWVAADGGTVFSSGFEKFITKD